MEKGGALKEGRGSFQMSGKFETSEHRAGDDYFHDSRKPGLSCPCGHTLHGRCVGMLAKAGTDG